MLDLPGAVAADGADAAVAAHYGSFIGEQRTLVAGDGFVDLGQREVLRVAGPDRLTWLHALTTQHLERLEAGVPTTGLVLSPQGHVEHAFAGVDDGGAFTLHTEPGRGAALRQHLERMVFMSRVEIDDLTADLAVAWRPVRGAAGTFDLVPRGRLTAYAAAAGPACGLWAYDALRIERGEPRLGVDTDHRTIPNEVGWVGTAVHLDKGCYRGQETVARVHNLGRPPRRLVRLLLDGTENQLPVPGAVVTLDGRAVGLAGSAARHHELGPIGLALVKRTVPVDAELAVDLGEGRLLPAAQEVVVDPEVGRHFRPMRG